MLYFLHSFYNFRVKYKLFNVAQPKCSFFLLFRSSMRIYNAVSNFNMVCNIYSRLCKCYKNRLRSGSIRVIYGHICMVHGVYRIYT